MRQPKALLFDLNGTLVDDSTIRESVQRTCADLAAARHGLNAARLLEANGEVWRAYWPEVEDRWTLGVMDGATVSLEAWRRTLRACGCDDAALAVLARDMHMRNARARMRLFDDAEDLFTGLVQTRLPLALVTNGASDSQRDALRTLNLEQRFSAVVISGEVGIAKPDAAIFAIAVDELRVQPEHAWHIGDSLVFDVAGARAAGLNAVWLNRARFPRNEGDPEPDHEIRSLRELAGLVSSGM